MTQATHGKLYAPHESTASDSGVQETTARPDAYSSLTRNWIVVRAPEHPLSYVSSSEADEETAATLG